MLKDCSKLEVFSRGFLQDALTLMKRMDEEGITRKDIKHYIKGPKKSGGRRQFGKPIGTPKPFGDKKNLGCKECRDKEKKKQ